MTGPSDDTDAASRCVASRELAETLLRRGADRIDLAREAFRRAYPEAPEQMISAAVFHVYVDGIDAAMEWLADAEQFLRNPDHRLCCGTSWHLIHHVYNWHQLEALMPHGKSGVLDLLDDISQFADEGEIDAIRQTVEELKKLLDGDETAPDFR